MRAITRTIKTTTVYGSFVNMFDGDLVTEEFEQVLQGEYTIETADIELAKRFPEHKVLVREVVVNEAVYKMDVEKFIELAERQ